MANDPSMKQKGEDPFLPERGDAKNSPDIVHRIDDGQSSSLGFRELQAAMLARFPIRRK
jgi:hypothetical protein